jgi:hypothetical protein
MRRLISILIFLVIVTQGKTQNLRYFEFTTQCGHGHWQDTSFIAATSNSEVIDSVLADLNRPYEQRKFISGPIAGGHGGHNHNADHWFKWHFVPNKWTLTDMSIELCDGCPYSDVDADTSYWLHNIGRFCPWSAKPAREVSLPTPLSSLKNQTVQIYPNPTTNTIKIKLQVSIPAYLSIFSVTGQLIQTTIVKNNETMDISHLRAGIYLLHLYNNSFSVTVKLTRITQ